MKEPDIDAISGWFAGRVPDGWFSGPPAVALAGGQIQVVGRLGELELPAPVQASLRAGAEAGRISRFRESTRGIRISIAREAEHRFELDVTWGATCGGTTAMFNPGGSAGRRHPDPGAGDSGGQPAAGVRSM